MKKEIFEDKAGGKTVLRLHYSSEGSMIIIFTDDTFIHFRPARCWDGCEIIQEGIDVEDWRESLVVTGIMTNKELTDWDRKRRKELSTLHEVNEKEEYIRLKEKYEGE